MQSKNITFLFYGCGSEYVLHSLYEEFSKRKYDCMEIDVMAHEDSRSLVDFLSDRKVVFITSAHLLMDKKNFSVFYKTENEFYGPLEVIDILKPLKSFFIPHDLTQPLIHFEEMFINQFDYFLSPCEPYTSLYSQYVKTEEVGWIKYTGEKASLKKQKNKAIWFLSDFVVHLTMGAADSFAKISPILKQGISIKFPLWEGSDEFEEFFSKKGIHVYPSQENSIDLISQHDIILTNGLSSVVAESYLLGKTTINIMEGSHYGDERERAFAFFPDIQFFEHISDFKLSKIHIQKRKALLQPLDMKKAIQLITQI